MKSAESYKDWVLQKDDNGHEVASVAVDSSGNFGDQLLLPFPPIKHLSTIQEESFSSMECFLESLSLDVESSANRGIRSLDASMDDHDDEVKSSPVIAPEFEHPVFRVTQNAHQNACLEPLFDRDSHKSRVIFCLVVSMVLLDTVLFVLADPWSPLYTFSVLLLGMILGTLTTILAWSWEANSCLCGGGEGNDKKIISHLTHLPDPDRMTPS